MSHKFEAIEAGLKTRANKYSEALADAKRLPAGQQFEFVVADKANVKAAVTGLRGVLRKAFGPAEKCPVKVTVHNGRVLVFNDGTVKTAPPTKSKA